MIWNTNVDLFKISLTTGMEGHLLLICEVEGDKSIHQYRLLQRISKVSDLKRTLLPTYNS
jgi:hypothetical protein